MERISVMTERFTDRNTVQMIMNGVNYGNIH